MNWMRRFLRSLGIPGAVGFAVLFCLLAFYMAGISPAEHELGELRQAVAQMRTRNPIQPVAINASEDGGRKFHGLFPGTDQLVEELSQLHRLAASAKLELLQGEYRLERKGTALTAYHIALPVRGSYGQLRAFIDLIMRDMPTVAVEQLRFERRKVTDAQLESQVRLTMYFQNERASQ